LALFCVLVKANINVKLIVFKAGKTIIWVDVGLGLVHGLFRVHTGNFSPISYEGVENNPLDQVKKAYQTVYTWPTKAHAMKIQTSKSQHSDTVYRNCNGLGSYLPQL
jgi:hypothetical protein